MKKSLKNIFLLLVLLFPFAVKADMGAPENTTYDVVVINPSGTCDLDYDSKTKSYVENTDKCLPYSFTLNVVFELNAKVDGKVQLLLEGYYDDTTYIIRSSDTELKGSYDSEYVYDYEEDSSFFVYYGNVPLYNGPSFKFGKVSSGVVIPAGTTVKKYKYTGSWDYVEYNGTYGWVYTYDNSRFDGDSYIIAKKETYYTKFIAPGSTLEVFKNEDLASNSGFSVTINVTPETEFPASYSDGEYMLLKINNMDYWVNLAQLGYVHELSTYGFTIRNSFKAYSNIALTKDEVTIPSNAVIYFAGWYDGYSVGKDILYFEYDGNYYWTDFSSLKFSTDDYEYELTTSSVKTIMVEDYESDLEEELEENQEEEDTTTETVSDTSMIVYVIAGTVGLSIAVIVIIILINRKKKNKKNDDKNLKEKEDKEEKLIEAELLYNEDDKDEKDE